MSTTSHSGRLSVHLDPSKGPRLAALIMVLSLTLFLVVSVVWMCFASLNISVQAVGAVIPSGKLQHIQSLEGGIVREFKVREGQQVKKGDLLGYLENLQYDAELGEGQQNQLNFEVSLTRLRAELAGKLPEFPEDLRNKAPLLVSEQANLAASRMAELNNSIDTINNQIAQRQQELQEAKSREQSVTALLASARETFAIEERLQSKNAGVKAEYLAAQREVTRLQGELDAAKLAIPRLQSAIKEAQSRLGEVKSKFRADAYRELNDIQAKSTALAAALTGRLDRVQRRELRAPMDAVVNRIVLNSIGGVARAGETIMELVPVTGTLLVSTRVKPSDIAFIREGEKARVRVSAYDSSIFGSLDAKVVRVGSDAVQDAEKKETFFEVVLETDRNYLGKPEERLIISSGMTVDASIDTGKRTIMEYLMKPIVKTFDKALRER